MESKKESKTDGEEEQQEQSVNDEPVDANESTVEPIPHTETSPPVSDASKTGGPRAWWRRMLAHKKVSLLLAVGVILAVVAAIPFTRYAVLGLFLKQSFPVMVVDSTTHKPISSALVMIDGAKATTDVNGKATLKVPVGKATLLVTKQYYKSFSQAVSVPIHKPNSAFTAKLEATGRQVPVSVFDKISGKGVGGVTVVAGDAQTKTDAKGQAILVVPAGKKELAATASREGYNNLSFTLVVTEQKNDANNLRLTPSGKIYFLSNASGKIDLIKSDLDGSNRQTVLAGTGKEDKSNTVLFASRDWKNIALFSRRDGGEYAKLFLIEAENDKVTTMDEGEANFTIIGWAGDRLIYRVDRKNVKEWEPKQQSIKSYHAPTKKIISLVDSSASGSQYSYSRDRLGDAYLFDQEVIYARNWEGDNVSLKDKQASLQAVRADGSQKKTIKTYPGIVYTSLSRGEFGELYIQYYDGSGTKYDEYQDGKVSSTKLTDDEFYSNGLIFAVSPSGKKTLWSDYRDGKYVIFVGDANGENGKQIGTTEDSTVYGWFTDDLLLLTRKGSELRILPVEGLAGGIDSSLKVSDYYKPAYGVRGYGYGYGG